MNRVKTHFVLIFPRPEVTQKILVHRSDRNDALNNPALIPEEMRITDE